MPKKSKTKTSKQKPKHTKRFLLQTLLFSLIISPIILLFCLPTRISTFDPENSFVQKGQILVSESISYFVRSPQINDQVLFYNNIDGQLWFGVVTNITTTENVTLYTITSRKNKKWVVTSNLIYRRVYYPKVTLTDQ